jgi:hypothetical protein
VAEDQFSDAFSTAFDAPTVSVPVPASCTPEVDWGCAYTPEQIAELDPAVKARSEQLAWATLQSLTGYQVAPCPLEVRPCTEGCSHSSWLEAPVFTGGYQGGGTFQPAQNGDGFWVNSCGCGRGDSCSCTRVSEIFLPGPVGQIVEVSVDGVVLDPSTYRVDNNSQLVAQGDLVWPSCQDMTAAAGEEGTFVVTYYRGFAPDAMTTYAAGVLASEFYRACTGKACRLPAGVTSITRQGVSMEIQTGMFSGGYTGIREVDAVISIYNPYGLRSPAVIISPETVGARRTTWRW